jgi:hypothetical protein
VVIGRFLAPAGRARGRRAAQGRNRRHARAALHWSSGGWLKLLRPIGCRSKPGRRAPLTVASDVRYHRSRAPCGRREGTGSMGEDVMGRQEAAVVRRAAGSAWHVLPRLCDQGSLFRSLLWRPDRRLPTADNVESVGTRWHRSGACANFSGSRCTAVRLHSIARRQERATAAGPSYRIDAKGLLRASITLSGGIA